MQTTKVARKKFFHRLRRLYRLKSFISAKICVICGFNKDFVVQRKGNDRTSSYHDDFQANQGRWKPEKSSGNEDQPRAASRKGIESFNSRVVQDVSARDSATTESISP